MSRTHQPRGHLTRKRADPKTVGRRRAFDHVGTPDPKTGICPTDKVFCHRCEFLGALADGVPLNKACEMALVGVSTYFDEVNASVEFAELCARARNTFSRKAHHRLTELATNTRMKVDAMCPHCGVMASYGAATFVCRACKESFNAEIQLPDYRAIETALRLSDRETYGQHLTVRAEEQVAITFELVQKLQSIVERYVKAADRAALAGELRGLLVGGQPGPEAGVRLLELPAQS